MTLQDTAVTLAALGAFGLVARRFFGSMGSSPTQTPCASCGSANKPPCATAPSTQTPAPVVHQLRLIRSPHPK